MNYRHIFHAGNFADVFKHVTLIALTKSFLRKDSAFCFIDSHAGAGSYDLASGSAEKSKEFENGIFKVSETDNKPELIKEYLSIILKKNSNQTIRYYPGSPLFVQEYLRDQDRMILNELNPEDFQTLKKFIPHKNVTFSCQDAYQSLKAYLPPKEKRGLILVDPPYEDANELLHLPEKISQAVKKFHTGIYAIWYPIKNRHPIEVFHRQLKEKISQPMLICELSIFPENIPTHLNGNGMIIINPPFQIEASLKEVLPWLWKTLSHNDQGHYGINVLK